MGKYISYLLSLYNKNTEKRNLLQFKCKRFLKLMTLSVYGLCGLAPTIRTLPEGFISNFQMLIFPTFRVHLYRQILLFSHHFQSF